MVGTVLVVGLGALGSRILQLLAHQHGVTRIIACDIDENRGKEVTENVRYGAASVDLFPHIKFVRADLFDIEGTMELIMKVKPSIICQATTLASGWLVRSLPPKMSKKISTMGIGPWIPCHLTLVHKLMQAVKQSGLHVHVVNTSYNDAISPILSKVGLAPTVGAGNVDLLVPRIQWLASKKLKVPMREVSVYLIAHHGVLSSVGKAPFIYKIMVRDWDVTDQISEDEIRRTVPERAAVSLNQVALSFVKNLLAIYFDTHELSHSPGPCGLPGGYPVRISDEEVKIVLPTDISLERARKINETAAKFDGIEKIKEDGTAVFTDHTYHTMKEVLGYNYKEVKLSEAEEKAKELLSFLKKTLKKYSVSVTNP